ncbi:hypothetical protein [Streptomyces nodosus]|uniref:hypothetical protein n=1 Tax=Streptomyces nodosus TaxID=40318 RepID=UPI0037FD6313
MDIDNLRELGARLEAHGLVVDICNTDLRLHVSNPLNSRLSEEITVTEGSFVTSFDYRIGERGREQECAERIACILAVSATPLPEASA